MEYPHQPVMIHEVLEHLVSDTKGVYVDGTVGSGGHSLAIGEKLAAQGKLICLDRDPDAIQVSKKRLSKLGNKASFVQRNYADIDHIINDLGFSGVTGILLDLGMSSSQLETSGRGFSFKRHEPLDMRMDPDGRFNAGDLVNELPVKDLENILRQYGEERRAKAIARAVVRNRKKRPIGTSYQLALIVKSVFPHTTRKKGVHPATRTFQALRIAVNKELENLKRFLNKAPDIVKKRGRVLIISYHSLEDRIVKQKMVDWESACKCPPDFPVCVCKKSPLFRRLFKKGIKPNQVEIESNPRARSAILRIAERI